MIARLRAWLHRITVPTSAGPTSDAVLDVMLLALRKSFAFLAEEQAKRHALEEEYRRLVQPEGLGLATEARIRAIYEQAAQARRNGKGLVQSAVSAD